MGTEKGLVVPVLKNADELSFADIEKNIKQISEKARDGKLTIEDLQGGTFTISNGEFMAQCYQLQSSTFHNQAYWGCIILLIDL